MHIIRGTLRITIFLTVLALSTLIISAIAWIPFRVKGIRVTAWPVTWLARFGLWIFNMRLDCPQKHRLAQHEGFVFPNHTSFMDIVVLLGIVPTRFVSNIGVRAWPFIGWIAMAIDTVFVNRKNKDSRAQTRQTLGKISYYPPVVLFPEGGIPDDEGLHPFRYGAFEIAILGQIPFIPCIILYNPQELVAWRDEPFFTVLWRIAAHNTPIHAHITLLDPVAPSPQADAPQLAHDTHSAMQAVIEYNGPSLKT